MQLRSHISNINDELKNIILGFLLGDRPKTAVEMHSELSDILADSKVKVPSAYAIYGHLHTFKDEKMASCDAEDTRQFVKYLSEQRFSIADEKYGAAARFLIKRAVEYKLSMFSVFGYGRKSNSDITGTAQHRVSLFEELSNGQPKTLAEIVKNTKMNRVIAYNNLHKLAELGLVNVPSRKIFEGDKYKIIDNFDDYFRSRIPKTVKTVLEYSEKGKRFTVDDIFSSMDEEDDNGCLRGQVFKILRRMELKNMLSTSKRAGLENTYSSGINIMDKSKFKSFYSDLMKEFLSDTDKALFAFYQENLEKNGSLEKFKHSDLSPFFKGISKHTIIATVKRLEAGHYVSKIADCKADKNYSLSDKGKSFWNEWMVPLNNLFERGRDNLVTAAGEYAAQNNYRMNHFIESALSLYQSVSHYHKRKPIEYRAERVMWHLIRKKKCPSKQELDRSFDFSLAGVIPYLLKRKAINVDKQGIFLVYTPTRQGTQKYGFNSNHS